jgi:hypothetical protein
MNPREREARGKAAVAVVTACYVDLDLRVPSRDKATWTRTQKALARRYSALGADPKVAGDESRVLRLVPYPNRKMSPDGVPTSIVYESEYRYELADLAKALAPEQGTPFSPVLDRRGVQRVMAVRIKPQAPTGARLPRELVGGRALDEGEEPAVRLL